MSTGPGASTRLIALLGDPVGHSLSPLFQNAAHRALGLDAVFLALRCDAERLPGLLRGIALAGGAGNVTVPHKRLALSAVDAPSEAVERTGACNAFWVQEGRVHGDNTDVAGFRAAVRDLLGGAPAGARVLLLGAGGAARAAVYALQLDGAAEVAIVNRSPARARELASALSGTGPARLRLLETAPARAGGYDLIVNATSLGLRDDDPPPLDPDAVPGDAVVLDLVYRAGRTAWVRTLAGRGVTAADGAGMLLAQGAAAFERWWDRPAPLEAMRTALERAL